MPQLSAFTPCGFLDLSGDPSHAEDLYALLGTLWGKNVDTGETGTYDESKRYAAACALATALYELDHAGNQSYPLRAYDLLPLLELDFGLVPGPLDNVPTRQAAVAAAELLPRGAVASNLVNAVKSLVGAANFLAIDPAPEGASSTVYPSSPGAGPGQFVDVRVPARTVQLVDPVVATGSAWCAYQNLDTSIPTPILLVKGDVVCVEEENTALAEKVTVTAIASTSPAGTTPGYSYFQATFTKAHDVGATVTTGNQPYWWSTQRLIYVVLTAAAALDLPTRRRVHALMAKLCRAVDQWAIVQPASTTATGGTVGPLTVGSAMGTQSIGAVSYTNSM